MSVVAIGAPVRIPAWVTDLASFRRWAKSGSFPTHGWIAHLAGELWVDLSMERAAHNQAKGAVSATLTKVAEQDDLGDYYSDRMLLTHEEAELSAEPDGMFVSQTSLTKGSVVVEDGDNALEVQGTPDMVLEVLSDTSVEKDTITLPELYWRAGINEYWMIDAREATLRFEILRRGPAKYIAVRKQGGWIRSQVFGKSFRLTRRERPGRVSKFVLEAK